MNMLVQALPPLVILFLVLVLIQTEGNSIPNTLHQNDTSVSSTISPWLKKVVKPRPSGCSGRPWVCNQGEFPPGSRCCRNRCVNVASDRNNCGLCGIRCPFNWQCCGCLCIDTNLSIFHCGRCGHRCPNEVLCYLGMCGYGQGSSPFLPEPPKPLQPPHRQSAYPLGYHQPPATAMEGV